MSYLSIFRDIFINSHDVAGFSEPTFVSLMAKNRNRVLRMCTIPLILP